MRNPKAPPAPGVTPYLSSLNECLRASNPNNLPSGISATNDAVNPLSSSTDKMATFPSPPLDDSQSKSHDILSPYSPSHPSSIKNALINPRVKIQSNLSSHYKTSSKADAGTPFSTESKSTRNSFEASSVLSSPAASFLAMFSTPTPQTTSMPNLFSNEPIEVGDYLLGKRISVSCFSEVREAVSINPKHFADIRFAVKIIRAAENVSETEDDFQAALSKEIALWKQLSHPNILPMIEVIETLGVCYIVSELIEGGSLLDVVNSRGALSEETVRHLVFEVCQGLLYLHEDCNIAHRDLKLENILVEWPKKGPVKPLLPSDFSKVKLCDFGLSEKCHCDTGFPEDVEGMIQDSLEASGTPEYCAPEELCAETDVDYFKSDIWSLGVVMYGLLCGKLPFVDSFWPRLQRSIKTGEFEPLPSHVSSEGVDLLKWLLQVNPKSRPRIREVVEHEWFGTLRNQYMGGGTQ